MKLHQIAPAPRAQRPFAMFPNFERMLRQQEKIDRLLRDEQRQETMRYYTDPDWWLHRAQGIEFRSDALREIRAAVATANFPNIGLVVGNSGGQVEQLPGVNTSGGRQRTWIDTLTLASQTNGTVIGVARIPLYSALLCIELITSISLGTATIAFGDANNGTLFAAAATLTSINTVTRVGASGSKGQPITSGYDSVTGNLVSPFMPQTPGQGGAMYEDIVMTVGAANLPASGTLNVMIEYLGPDS